MNEAAIYRVEGARRCIKEALYRLEMTGLPTKFDGDIISCRIRLGEVVAILAEVQRRAKGDR
jgi:hypothetical protein